MVKKNKYFTKNRRQKLDILFPQQKNEESRHVVASFKAFCLFFKPFNKRFWNVIFVHHLKTKRFMKTESINVTAYVESF